MKSDAFEALNLLGIIAAQTRRTQEAVELLGRAVAVNPANAATHLNYGNVLQQLGRLDQALASYDRALRLAPESAEAYNNRGNTLRELKRLDDALDSYGRALKIKPDYAEAYNNRGVTLQALGRLAEALESYALALKIKPDYSEAYNNRGATLQGLKRLDEALDSYDRALRFAPHSAEAHSNRGNTLRELKRLDEALESYALALKIKPDYVEAYHNRGNALIGLHRYLEAAQCFKQLLELAPDFSFAKGSLLHAKMLSCEWTNLSNLCESIAQDVLLHRQATAPFEYQGISHSEQALRTCAEVYAAKKFPKKEIQICTRRIRRHGKIRVGYLSGEFRNQATSALTVELFELHARNRFEIFAFDNGWDDGSEIRKRINKAFHEILDITRMPDLQAAELVNSRGIDILVNLNGYFGEARPGIFAHKPSPIQVNYLGFPGTLGADYIDYLIADSILIPRTHQQHYSEKIVYLPNSYQVNDRKRAIADRTFSREELGLPRKGFVFCCFNNNYKITPSTFDGWMRILRKVEGSVLWLLQDNPVAASNLRKEASARGVSAGRLIFAERIPLAEHLARHRAADLFVDTLPYNAHTTASDALWAGLPLLTCIGQTFPGRVAASLLKAVDLPELITTTPEQYEALAVELAINPQLLDQIKNKLGRKRLTSPLFDTQLFTKHIEEAYTQMYERHQADLSPEHIYVSS